MNIKDYLLKLNSESQSILNESLIFQDELGKAHHYAACIYEFAENINDLSEKNILNTVSSQLETSTLNASLGMYRQSFASLRLALEMGLAAAHFSVHKLDFQDWLAGRADIKWSLLIDDEEGVLSKRFTRAFFEEFTEDVSEYRSKAKTLYRELSEFVHGNNDTWIESGLELKYNEDLLKSYFQSIEVVAEVVLYVLCCRYLKSFSNVMLESMEFIPEEMKHVHYIREYFGGPRV